MAINLKKDTKSISQSKKHYLYIFALIVVFGVGFLTGKMTSSINTTNNEVAETNNTGDIIAPFKASDIVVTAKEAEQTSEGYIIRGKITNNSNTPLEGIIVTINVNNGEDVAYFDTLGSTIMPGKSFAGESISVNKIKSLKPIEASASWSDNNNTYSSDIDFQLNKIETVIWDY